MKKVKNLRISEIFKNLKKKVEEFHEDVEYYDTLHRNIGKIRLTGADFNVSESIKILEENNFENNFDCEKCYEKSKKS